MRKRTVARGFVETIVISNHSPNRLSIEVRIQGNADFADLFEVKDALHKKGRSYRRVEPDHLVLGYKRDEYVRETWIVAPDASIDEGGLTYRVRLGPHGQWSTRVEVRVVSSSGDVQRGATDRLATREERHKRVEHALAEAPRVRTDWVDLLRTYERSIIDLTALRYFPLLAPGSLPAAGLPWFMAVFGRDSLITSLQALPFAPELAETTLRVLAARQGARIDAFRDEEPGKILHESRIGEMTAFAERPHSPYFGSADATPLFLVLLDEYELWTGDGDLVRRLEHPARAALEWLDDYGDRMRNGYISYERRNQETGLENQCWKDSWNSIAFRDGTLAGLPRACCEIQGYAYDARMRCARLARMFWNDSALAARLEERAADLKERFNRDFWMPDRECFALAIDGDGRQVDSITSNIGHLLWSGIVDTDKAPHVVRAPDERPAVLRLGRPHDGRGRGGLQSDRLSRRHGLAARQLDHRARPDPVRVSRGVGPHRIRNPPGGAVLQASSPRDVRRLPAANARNFRSSTPLPAARKRGPAELRSCSFARCSGSNRVATV